MNVSFVYVNDDLDAFGIRGISSGLKQAGHRTRLILMPSAGTAYSRQVLEEAARLLADSDVVGISCFSRASDKAIQVIEHIRALRIVTVWGGIHATLNPEQCVKHADVVCRGEGEGFMLELLERLGNGGDWRGLCNAAHGVNGDIVMEGMRPLISDLDELPFLDFTRENEFHLKGNRFVRIQETLDGAAPISFNGTRGCAFDCTYCSNSKLKQLYAGNGRYARRLTVSKLIDHAEDLRNRFPGAKCINFFDEDFLARSLAEIREFSEKYSTRIGIPFECMVSPVHVSEEKMGLLVEAGLWRINMGVESGSERTKKEIYNRHMSNRTVMRAARNISRHPKVVPYYFFILGNPYEEADDLIATAEFVRDLPCPFFLRAYNLVFFPGTLLYESAVRDGIIEGGRDSGFELDFLGGFNYRSHAWKSRNLYLNGLLYLMAGKATRRRLGLVPRFCLGFLIRPGVIRFNEKHTALIRMLILFKTFVLRMRSFAAYLLKKLFNDPTSIYDLKQALLSRVRPRQKPGVRNV